MKKPLPLEYSELLSTALRIDAIDDQHHGAEWVEKLIHFARIIEIKRDEQWVESLQKEESENEAII